MSLRYTTAITERSLACPGIFTFISFDGEMISIQRLENQSLNKETDSDSKLGRD